MSGFDCDLAGLFEGYGGLTMGVRSVLGGDLGWYSEIEPAACRILAHHHPGVPNLGDITTVEWGEVLRPRVLTGGFPCQDVSAAGRRAGMRPDSRSGLWTHMARAINVLRPELVLIENVRGLLSAEAACDVEPCPWCLGDHEHRPLRALGAVLGDLAVLGYDARWCGLRAADVGAPHGRFRIFIAARPAADSGGGELQRRRVGGVVAGAEGAGAGEGPERERDRDTAGDGCADAADADGVGPVRGGGTRGRWRGPADAGVGRGEGRAEPAREFGGSDAAVGGGLDWGAYAPAIERWELILGRPAPAPTQTGKRGGQQLSPAFVEFLMGLPEGHVTAVPGVSRNEALKALGNGVVPQQAAFALAYLLTSSTDALKESA